MKLTLKRLQLLERVKDEFEEELDKLARHWATISKQNRCGCYEGFSIWGNVVAVYYRDFYQGGWDDYTVNIPFDVFDRDDLAAAAEEALKKKKELEEIDTKRRVALAQLARKRQYEQLKEEFG